MPEMARYKLLETIRSPADLKKLALEQLSGLCAELRAKIIEAISKNGGHLASNLGVVELTVALHRVFQAPRDRIVWDVGHQTYAHKILTGRGEAFSSIRRYGGLSGFPSPRESPFDPFIAGHAGTAVSAAVGFEAANEYFRRKGRVIAVVGDGSLNNGLTMEALNNVRSTCRNLIIVINDNKMSISKSVGAISNYLNRIITGSSYNRFKAFVKMAVARLPGNAGIIGGIQKLEGAVKSLFVPGIWFEELGLRYIGPVDGHDLPMLIRTFERVGAFTRPAIVHVITKKGAGCPYAAAYPEKFHGVAGFNPATGAVAEPADAQTFSAVFGDALCTLAEAHPELVGITAAMRFGTGMTAFSERFPDRFYDVGIAEGHALTFGAGLAAGGRRPVVAVYATFLQRALDSLYHDICLPRLPVVLCVDRAGVVEDGPTHHGLYDESFALAMPGLCVMAPKNEAELREMLFFAYELNAPAMIRYPRGSSGLAALPSAPLEKGRAEAVRAGADLAFWAVGREVGTALAAAEILQRLVGLSCRVVNARFLKPFDDALLRRDAGVMPVVTLEDTLAGTGLAAVADRLLAPEKHCGVLHFAWPADREIPHGDPAALRERFGLTAACIARTVRARLFPDRPGKNRGRL